MSAPGLANVSISFTSAVVYAVSGLIFLLLIFLLVLMGVSNCDCHCSRIICWRKRSVKSIENKNYDVRGDKSLMQSLELPNIPGLPLGPAKGRLLGPSCASHGPSPTVIDMEF